jgi:hypothetical protein
MKLLALPLITVLVALGLMAQFLLKPLRPWWDESRLLQAAVRHAQGEGLTYSAQSTDLTRAAYQPLTHWPPAYSLAVSGLVRIGLAPETAAKGINVVALVLGLLGWLGLASRFLSRALHRTLFAGLLVFAGGATDLAGYTTDFLLWAAVPYWLYALLQVRRSPSPARAWVWTAAAAVLAAGLIGVRWAAAFLAPAGVAAILWPGPHAGSWLGRLVRAALYGLPSVLVYFALGRGGGYTSGIAFTPKWEFENLLTPYPFESLFSAPLGLRPVLARAGIIAGSYGPSLILRLAVPALCLALLLATWLRRPKERAAESDLRELGLLFGLSFTALFALLSYLAVRYRPDNLAGWSYLAEARYFQPLFPAAALFWLTLLAALGRTEWLARCGLAVVGLCLACLVLGELRGQYHRGVAPDESWELVRQVRGLESRGGLQVIVSDSVADYVVGAGPALVLAECADYAHVPSRIGREADLWVVADADGRRLDALRDRFDLCQEWVSSRGNYALYHARIVPDSRMAAEDLPSQ